MTGTGSVPRTLVNMAKKQSRAEKRLGERFDKIYCVFDRDEHPDFDKASAEAKASGIDLARSWPCFEYWLLLHFQFSRRPFGRSGNRSPAKVCIDELRKHLPEYAKGQKKFLASHERLLETALRNAERAAKEAVQTDEDNPSTEIHLLVKYLQAMHADTTTSSSP